MQELFQKTSWFIMILSLLIDIISHVRSFPSYNIVIGVFTWYAAQSVLNRNDEETKVLDILSAFTILNLCSLLLDVSFCFIWGRDIIEGDIRSVKFSFAVFILNMLPKAVAVIFAVAIQIEINENEDSPTTDDNSLPLSTPKRVRFQDDEENVNTCTPENQNRKPPLTCEEDDIVTSRKSNTDDSNDIMIKKKNEYIISSLFPHSASPIENLSYDGSEDGNIVLEDIPLPPFSPGVPGLVSPFPRKPKLGVSPPKPPSRSN